MTDNYEYGAMYCRDCNLTHYYRANLMRVGREWPSEFRCPRCTAILDGPRQNVGYELLGSKDGDRGCFHCRFGDAYIESMDELIGALKLYRVLVQEIASRSDRVSVSG